MHDALATGDESAAFEPESFTPFYRRALHQSLRNATHRALTALSDRAAKVPPDIRADAKRVLDSERLILKTFNESLSGKIRAKRIRVHGDYHLCQVLHTGRDFVIIDFEGEPGRSLGERRTKRCALADVAGMLRSLQYAAFAVLFRRLEQAAAAESEATDMKRSAATWVEWTSRVYLNAYIGCVNPKILGDAEEIERLLRVYLLEKAIYELSYEINNRPTWVKIPLSGIIQLLGTGGSAS
jgi:maltose alpha-D-glucosyltransferase/alpha-amylase